MLSEDVTVSSLSKLKSKIRADVASWRSRPGYLSSGGSEFESIHILLGRFLGDRRAPNPLAERSLLADNATFEWGKRAAARKGSRFCRIASGVDASAAAFSQCDRHY